MDGSEALELARAALKRMTQSELADEVGVSGATISRWLDAKSPPSRGLSKLVAWAERLPPLPTPAAIAAPDDYWRGVLYAAEAMAETTARLLREARHADEETVRQTARAVLFGTLPASESERQGTNATGPSRAPLPRAAKNA